MVFSEATRSVENVCLPVECERLNLVVYGVSTFARYRIRLTVNMLLRSRECLTVMITAWELTN